MTAPVPVQPAALVEQKQEWTLGGDPLIVLFELDLVDVFAGGPILRFTSTIHWDVPDVQFGGRPIRRGGFHYVPIQIEASGFDLGGDGGRLPQPIVRIANVSATVDSLAHQFDGLVAAKLTRIVVTANYLDGGADEDPTAYLKLDVYLVEQKSEHTREAISWRLVAELDQAGEQLPHRQAFRDVCSHRYRQPLSGGGFDYTTATCPYIGATFFDYKDDETLNHEEDQCRKQLRSCKKRFGETADLPTTAFPGLGSGR